MNSLVSREGGEEEGRGGRREGRKKGGRRREEEGGEEGGRKERGQGRRRKGRGGDVHYVLVMEVCKARRLGRTGSTAGVASLILM